MGDALSQDRRWRGWFGILSNSFSSHPLTLSLISAFLTNQALPYSTNPSQDPAFKAFFTSTWAETLSLSICNFLASLFNSIGFSPPPPLCLSPSPLSCTLLSIRDILSLISYLDIPPIMYFNVERTLRSNLLNDLEMFLSLFSSFLLLRHLFAHA